jgi:hypothetical protein
MTTATQLPPANSQQPNNGSRGEALAPTNNLPTVARSPANVIINGFDDLARFSNMVANSGFAPKGFNPQGIGVAIQFGLELGLAPMQALQSVAVINGRPGIYGDAAKALVMASGLCSYFYETPSNDEIHGMVEEMSAALDNDDFEELKSIRKRIAKAKGKLKAGVKDYGCSVLSRRKGDPMSKVNRFTVADAETASLWGKAGPWKQYPDRMLMFRARGFNLRDNFADILRGLRTAEELYDIEDNTGADPLPVGRVDLRMTSKPAIASGTEAAFVETTAPAPGETTPETPDPKAQTTAPAENPDADTPPPEEVDDQGVPIGPGAEELFKSMK